MDFIQKYIINTNAYIQMIPVIAGIICYSKLNKAFKLFVWLLLFTVFLEIFKEYYGTYIHVNYNRIWTNIYNIIYFSFLFWFFHRKTNHKKFKTVIKFFIAFYFLSIIYELCFQKLNYHLDHQIRPYIIGGLGIIACVFDYLIGVINLKKKINVFSEFIFWFVIAHFIYFLVYTLFKIIDNEFSLIKDYHHLFIIKVLATYIKCIILSIGFLWTTYKKEK